MSTVLTQDEITGDNKMLERTANRVPEDRWKIMEKASKINQCIKANRKELEPALDMDLEVESRGKCESSNEEFVNNINNV